MSSIMGSKTVGIVSLLFFSCITIQEFSQYPDQIATGRRALLDLYEATGGDNWHNNSGWGEGNPSDAWYGVEVNTDGRVTRLDLLDNGLSGSLPESIGNLTEVRYINIKQNAIGGDLPLTIGNLENVVYLLLSGTEEEPPTNPQHTIHQGKSDNSGNSFTGTIPAVLGNLSNLEYLELSGSQVTGEIPSEIGNATNLKFIAFSWNPNLTGGIPSTIGNLKNLIWLFVRASSLDGTLPDELGQVTSLRTIHLGYNSEHDGEGLTGELPDLSDLTNLRNFNVDENDLSGPWPNYWNNGDFENLVALRATWNNFHTNQLHGFDNLPSLKTLGLGGNDLSGTIDRQLLTLPPHIKIIGLNYNDFTGSLPQGGWVDFSQLRNLYLNNNNLTGSISCELWNKIDNPSLRRVRLNGNQFDSNCKSAMDSVAGNSSLEIKIGGNNF